VLAVHVHEDGLARFARFQIILLLGEWKYNLILYIILIFIESYIGKQSAYLRLLQFAPVLEPFCVLLLHKLEPVAGAQATKAEGKIKVTDGGEQRRKSSIGLFGLIV